MKDAKLIWSSDLEKMLENLISILRKSIISDAEDFAKFRNSDSVNAQGLETALYKSVMTLNESNKATMFQRFGPTQAIELIHNLEDQAVLDVTMTVIEDMERNWDNLPQELKDMITQFKKKKMKKDKEY